MRGGSWSLWLVNLTFSRQGAYKRKQRRFQVSKKCSFKLIIKWDSGWNLMLWSPSCLISPKSYRFLEKEATSPSLSEAMARFVLTNFNIVRRNVPWQHHWSVHTRSVKGARLIADAASLTATLAGHDGCYLSELSETRSAHIFICPPPTSLAPAARPLGVLWVFVCVTATACLFKADSIWHPCTMLLSPDIVADDSVMV